MYDVKSTSKKKDPMHKVQAIRAFFDVDGLSSSSSFPGASNASIDLKMFG